MLQGKTGAHPMSLSSPTNRDAQVQQMIEHLITELMTELHYSRDEATRIAEVSRPIYTDLLPRPASEGTYGRHSPPPVTHP
jgi:hypothetical protein